MPLYWEKFKIKNRNTQIEDWYHDKVRILPCAGPALAHGFVIEAIRYISICARVEYAL